MRRLEGVPAGTRVLVGERLTTWSVSPDGDRARLGFTDAAGHAARLDLPVEAVSGLLMTLPRILQHALRVAGDDSTRMVQPLGDWRLEQDAGTGQLILTLSTPDGFSVAFTLAGEELAAMADLASGATAWPDQMAGRNPPGRVVN